MQGTQPDPLPHHLEAPTLWALLDAQDTHTDDLFALYAFCASAIFLLVILID